MHEADGAILMYNPDAPGQDQQIGDWFDFFVRKNGLKDEKCIVFAHRTKQTNDRFRPRKFSDENANYTCNKVSSILQLYPPYFIIHLVLFPYNANTNTCCFVAPIFSNLTAALTTEQSGQDVKNMFENLIRDIYQSKSRK